MVDNLGRELRCGRRGPQPDAVHKIRVAGRRLRECLWIFAKATGDPGGRLESCRAALRRLALGVGPIRERDVALGFLRGAGGPLPAGLRRRMERTLGPVLRRDAESRRRAARSRLADADALLKTVRRRVETARGRRFRHPSNFVKVMVWRRLRRARLRYGRIRGAADGRRWHRFRISVKKLRYVIETLSPHVPGRWTRRLPQLKRTQSLIGRLQDDRVSARHFFRAARSLGSAAGRAVGKEAGKAFRRDYERRVRLLDLVVGDWFKGPRR